MKLCYLDFFWLQTAWLFSYLKKILSQFGYHMVITVSGIARCFTFGGSRHRVLHDPRIEPRSDLSKDKYMNKEEQTTVNHFHEKLLKLKGLMKTQVNLSFVSVYFILPLQNLIIVQEEFSCESSLHYRLVRKGLRKGTNLWRSFWRSSMKSGMGGLKWGSSFPIDVSCS